MHGPIEESLSTKAISTLVKKISSNTPVKDSLFEQAQVYFETAEANKKAIASLQKKIKSAKETLSEAGKRTATELTESINKHDQELKALQEKLKEERRIRFQQVLNVLTELLMLSEGNSWDETQVSSAKVLGTLQLLSPGEGKKLRQIHQTLKPAYKGVLALRLLDKLIDNGHLTHPYIKSRHKADTRFSQVSGELTVFQRDISIPILIAAIFQDVGLLHPDAINILKGEDGTQDEFRLLEMDDRRTLLKLNYEHSLDYVTNGLGLELYVGNSKEERDTFEANEKERLQFTRTMLKDALKPKLGVGNLIKVPQIYTSVIFSTKISYNFMDLPKASLVVGKAAESGSVSQVAADSFLEVVGHFPQGYGVIFIPKDSDNQDLDRYEYGIVTELNPSDPYVPRCRAATRNLTFISNGQVISVSVNNNLYFPAAKKKLEKVSPERLKEILSKLVSNFKERMELELIPSYWNPYNFFCYKKLQNLWKRT